MSFQQGLTGIMAAAKRLDVTGNNIANANTVGFKRTGVVFADMYAQGLQNAAGMGVTPGTTFQNFKQGSITSTSNALDLAIAGNGFFKMQNPVNKEITYSRNGQFHLDKDGNIVNAADLMVLDSNDTAITINKNANRAATTSMQLKLNLDPRVTPIAAAVGGANFNLAKGPEAGTDATYNWSATYNVYDSTGKAHNMTYFFTKTAVDSGTGQSTWQVLSAVDNKNSAGQAIVGSATGAAGIPDAIGTLVFNSDGSLSGFTAGALANTAGFLVQSLDTAGTVTEQASPLFGAVAITDWLKFDGSTQYSGIGSTQAFEMQKGSIIDGYPMGEFSSVEISDRGEVYSVYTNGNKVKQAQIFLTDFMSPEKLQPAGNNQWKETSAAGTRSPGLPGSAGLGFINSQAVEESNVDLTAELVDLIVAQRVYQANAQTVSAQNQALQTAVNLR